MDRSFFNILTILLVGYILGFIFNKKTLFALLWVLNRLEEPFEFLRRWLDVIYASAAILLLGFLTYSYWPLSNDDSQLLIFLVTGFTLFFQAVIGDRSYKYRNRPIIDIEFDDKEADCFHKTTANIQSDKVENNQVIPFISPISSHYARLKVLNKGKEMLKNVEAVIEAVDPGSERPFLPLSLNWSFLKQTDLGLVRYAQIPQRCLELWMY